AAEIWTMNGVSVTSMTTLAGPGSTWHVAATGDFNGDGKSDILFQNSDGTPEVWLMNGTSVTTQATLGGPQPSLHIVATADFNQDGDADILFQNTSTGAPVIWTMNGTSVTHQTTVGNPGAATGLALIGAGEYNGNGQPELLFQNTGTGAPVIWTMSGTSFTGSTTLANPGGSNWHANTG
ncbi:MAG TPA: VCBS repeat-containing protein, partial [Xanthobacteraceae bacterium]